MTMRFREGDKVRNVRFDMGPGIITRHAAGPRSIRWAAGDAWWVCWPRFRDPRWLDPGQRGHDGWSRDDVLTLDEDPERTEALYEHHEGARQQAYEDWLSGPHEPGVYRGWQPEAYARPAVTVAAGWEDTDMSPQDAYDRLRLYESNGMLTYVLPSEPLGESWVLGIKDGPGLAKFTGTNIIDFIIGAETVIKFMARQRGLL